MRPDPLLHDIDLPLRATFHPMGFRVDLSSNSPRAIEAAEESWGDLRPEFDRPPISVRVVVCPDGAAADAFPVYRSQGRLFSIVYDRDNFAAFESTSMSGYCLVSQKTVEARNRFRVYFLEAMVYMLMAQRYAIGLHGACVARNGAGVLLCGASGAGKSTLAFACARAGWEFLSDDATWLVPDAGPRVAVGKLKQARFRADAPRLFPELARYPVAAHPSGKMGIEAPLADFPEIRVASRCTIERLVHLDRRTGMSARVVPVSSAEAVTSLLLDLPSYGEDVNEWYERSVRQLEAVPAYCLEYESLEDAVQAVSELLPIQ
ncbi:MAG TPA: hypothetical protein VGF59_05400 [Bryobacteraceae bacterium]